MHSREKSDQNMKSTMKNQNKTILKVIVKPRSTETKILEIDEEKIKFGVKAVPRKGKANKELVKAIAELLKIPTSKVEIIKGHKTHEKLVMIQNISKEEVFDKFKMSLENSRINP